MCTKVQKNSWSLLTESNFKIFLKEIFLKEIFLKEIFSKEIFSKELFSKELFLKEIFLKEIFSNLKRNLSEPRKKSWKKFRRTENEEKVKIILNWIWITSLKGQNLTFSIVINRETYNIKYWTQMGWNIPTVWSCKPASPLKVPFPSSVTVFRSLFINFSMEKASIKKERNSRTIYFHT